MKQVEVTVTIKAAPDVCFSFVGDHANTTRYMGAIKRYQPITPKTTGKGARFDCLLVVGGHEIEAVMETTGWVAGEKIVGTTIKGPKTRGSWTFQEFDDGTTDVTLLHEYELPGIFRLASGPISRGIEKELEQSLGRLKKLVEAEAKSGTAKASRRPPGKSSPNK